MRSLLAIIAVILLVLGGASPAVAAEPAAQQAAPKTLIDVGTADAVFLVTIKAGVITVEVVKVITPGSSGPVDPPPPIDTPPVDVAKAFADAIAKVVEPTKVETAGTLKKMIDPVLGAAAKGELTDIEGTKTQLPFVLSLVTMTKPDWAGFSTALKTQLEKVATAADVAVVLRAASDELGKVK